MRSLLTLFSPSLLALGLACGPYSNGQWDEGEGLIGSHDTSEVGITAFVREGRYRDWVAEPTVHATRSPHQARYGSSSTTRLSPPCARAIRCTRWAPFSSRNCSSRTG
jgi:hypothetical protein